MKQNSFLLPFFTINLFISFAVDSIVFRNLENADQHAALAADNPAFDPVGKVELAFVNEDTDKEAKEKIVTNISCTGVLVDERTVLITADCIAPLVKNEKATFKNIKGNLYQNTFTLGNNAYDGSIVANVISANYHRDFKLDKDPLRAPNVALLYLDPPITQVPPAKLFPGKHTDVVGKKVTMVGFGLIGDPRKGVEKKLNSIKYACTQTVSEVMRAKFKTRLDRMGNQLDGMFTNGDNGGPMFMEHNNEWFVVGVNAFYLQKQLLIPTQFANDPTYVPFGTEGYSIAIPTYRSWIKEGLRVKTVTRKNDGESVEWSYDDYWKGGKFPDNSFEKVFRVNINKPGTLLIDRDYTVDGVTISHEGATLYQPPRHIIAATEKFVEDYVELMLKNNQPFEAIEFQRTLKDRIDEKHCTKIPQFKTQSIALEKGKFHVEGEVGVDIFTITGGTLFGSGNIQNSTEPVLNKSGVVHPGGLEKMGTLTIDGDYQQEKNGTLAIRVNKAITRKNRTIIQSDKLRSLGQITLGGTLKLEPTGRPLEPNDEFVFLSGVRIDGKFDHVEVPDYLSPKVSYLGDRVKIGFTFAERTPLVMMGMAKHQMNQPTAFSSVLIAGGEFEGLETLFIDEGNEFALRHGTLKVNPKSHNRKFTIRGDYRQTNGTLSIGLNKTYSEVKVMQEAVKLADNRVILKENASAEDLAQGSIFEVPSIKPQYTYHNDTIVVKGKATLGGTLEFALEDEFILRDGLEITILQADQIEGTFATISEFPFMIQPNVIYTPTEVKIQFEAKPYRSAPLDNSDAVRAANLLDGARLIKDKAEKMRALFTRLDMLNPADMQRYLLQMIKEANKTEKTQVGPYRKATLGEDMPRANNGNNHGDYDGHGFKDGESLVEDTPTSEENESTTLGDSIRKSVELGHNPTKKKSERTHPQHFGQ